MKLSAEQYCNRCGRKIDWDWLYGQGEATSKAWTIWFPSQTAGGSAGSQLEDFCWECYGKVCKKLERIYNFEFENQVEFVVKTSVSVKK